MKLKHKYNAKPCESADGIKFASMRERSWYLKLKILQVTGDVLFFIRQVPFDLPGKTTYRADFMVFYTDGSIKVLDVKGVETEVFKLKKRQMEEIYPFEIEVVK